MSSKRGADRNMGDVETATIEVADAAAGLAGYGLSFRLPEPPPVETQIVESDNLKIAKDGSFRVGKFRLSSIGLRVDEEISEAEWREVGDFLKRADSARQLWLGDWINSCNAAWGETYKLAMEVTGYAEQTLTNFAYVTRQVDFSLRKENLFFGHYNLVAAMPAELQRDWLEYAAAEKLSIAALRKAIAGADTGTANHTELGLRIEQLATRTKAITRAVNNRDKLTADQRQSAKDEITVARRILDWADSLFGEE